MPEIDVEMMGVVGGQLLTCVHRRDQLSLLVARRQIVLTIIALVLEEFVESEALERIVSGGGARGYLQERVS